VQPRNGECKWDTLSGNQNKNSEEVLDNMRKGLVVILWCVHSIEDATYAAEHLTVK